MGNNSNSKIKVDPQIQPQNIQFQIEKLLQYASEYYAHNNQFYNRLRILSPYLNQSIYSQQIQQFHQTYQQFLPNCRKHLKSKKIKVSKIDHQQIRNTYQINRIFNQFSFITKRNSEISENTIQQIQDIIQKNTQHNPSLQSEVQFKQQYITPGKQQKQKIQQFADYNQQQEQQLENNAKSSVKKLSYYLNKKYGSIQKIDENSQQQTMQKQNKNKQTQEIQQVIQFQKIQQQIMDLQSKFYQQIHCTRSFQYILNAQLKENNKKLKFKTPFIMGPLLNIQKS